MTIDVLVPINSHFHPLLLYGISFIFLIMTLMLSNRILGVKSVIGVLHS